MKKCKTTNLIFGFDIPKPQRKVNGKKAFNWFQAKKKYPTLSPFGDADNDGVPNWLDCRPFDRTRQMVFKKTDAGRRAAGFKGKTGDCFTRAYAITEGKGYKEAYDELAEKFSKMKPMRGKFRGSGVSHPRTGVYKKHAELVLKEKGYKWTPTSGIGKGFQMHLKEGELPKGKNILKVSKHFVASEDQDWFDSHDASRKGTRGVYGYWHAPEKEKEKEKGNKENEED